MRREWVLACALAETIGMSASAGATRGGESRSAALGFALVLLGGLVEGAALGVAQSWALAPRLAVQPGGRARWILATVLVAGLGWAAGSAPATLAGDDGGTTPPLGLVLLGAAGMGLVLGPLLGAAQALVLRHRVRHPWRWVAANAAGWTVAMPVVFLGATTAGAGWPWPALVAYGAVTGAVAGTALGAVTGVWLPTLDGLPVRHRSVLLVLALRRASARDGWTGLTVTGARTGRAFSFPVMAAPLGRSSLVVLPGHPERKSWWRQIHGRTEVGLLDHGVWVTARARVLEQGTLEWSVARAAYITRWPRTPVGNGPLVVLDLRAGEVFRGDEGPPDVGPDAVGAAATDS